MLQMFLNVTLFLTKVPCIKTFRVSSLYYQFETTFTFVNLIPEAATGGVLQNKLFLEISKNSQENTFARVSF